MIASVPSLSADIFMWTGLSVGVITTLTLLVMLIQKEFISSFGGVRANRVARALGFALIPLGMIFVTSMVVRIMALMH